MDAAQAWPQAHLGGKKMSLSLDNGVSTFEELSPRAKQAFLRYPLKFSNSHHAYLPV